VKKRLAKQFFNFKKELYQKRKKNKTQGVGLVKRGKKKERSILMCITPEEEKGREGIVRPLNIY